MLSYIIAYGWWIPKPFITFIVSYAAPGDGAVIPCRRKVCIFSYSMLIPHLTQQRWSPLPPPTPPSPSTHHSRSHTTHRLRIRRDHHLLSRCLTTITVGGAANRPILRCDSRGRGIGELPWASRWVHHSPGLAFQHHHRRPCSHGVHCHLPQHPGHNNSGEGTRGRGRVKEGEGEGEERWVKEEERASWACNMAAAMRSHCGMWTQWNSNE